MELRKRQRSGPEPPRAVTRLSADFMNDGSAAEAAARLMSALLQGSSCIVLEAVSWGLGSSFNFIWWITTLVKAVRPETAVHYNHAPSPYQCFENRSLEAFMTQAANGFLRPGPPTPAACRRHTHMDNVRLKNALFPGRTFAEDWFINRTTAGPTDVLRNNLYHQVRQWWGRRKQEKSCQKVVPQAAPVWCGGTTYIYCQSYSIPQPASHPGDHPGPCTCTVQFSTQFHTYRYAPSALHPGGHPGHV